MPNKTIILHKAYRKSLRSFLKFADAKTFNLNEFSFVAGYASCADNLLKLSAPQRRAHVKKCIKEIIYNSPRYAQQNNR